MRFWVLFQAVRVSEADVYAERYYQERRIIHPQGAGDTLVIIDARLKNLLEKARSPYLTERQPGNTGLIDNQGRLYPPEDYDARQEKAWKYTYAAAILSGAVADFALVFSVPKGTRATTLVFTVRDS